MGDVLLEELFIAMERNFRVLLSDACFYLKNPELLIRFETWV